MRPWGRPDQGPPILPTDPTHPFADFRNFVYVVWKYLGLPDPSPLQYDIAYFLQHGPKRSIIEAFRGCGKSFLTAAFALWCLYWDQNFKIMVVSASKERADAFSQFCLRLIREMPELQHLAPRPDQRSSLVAFDVNGATVDQSPSLKSVGITGQLTGSRADLIIADDVETPKNSMTATQREKLEELVKEFDAVLKTVEGARILYLGTPQCEDSLYNKLATKGYVARIWPVRKPSPSQAEKYGGKLAPFIENLLLPVGASVEPRFKELDLVEREASYGRSGFALQFMLDTSLSDALKFPLRCSDFIVMDVDREMAPVKVVYASSDACEVKLDCVGLKGDRWYGPMFASQDYAPFEESVMFIDPSGRGEDKTAFAIVKSLKGMLYLKRATGLPGGYDELTLQAIARAAQAENVTMVIVESNFGDGMFTQLLKPVMQRIHPCGIEEVRHSKQKELRIIDTLEPVLNQHRLVVDKSVVLADQQAEREHQLFYQLTRLTREKGALAHDDLLDAVAGAVAHFSKVLDVDNTDAEKRHREELLDREIEKFMANALGRSLKTRPNWTRNV